ncbi:hypothetical protein C8F01DRAFT_1361405 [Mycena amicta]|nr:hypothetical protein C8F01DRAFT_1361405 [Mycena amicta]
MSARSQEDTTDLVPLHGQAGPTIMQRLRAAQETWSEATDEIERLQTENAELKETVRLLSSRLMKYQSRVSVAELPHEILLMIFRKCLPPSWMLVRELIPDSLYATDLERKTFLALVCKAWNRVASDLLYGNVHLRSVGQVVSFARALETQSGLGPIVRHLELSCFVPRGYRAIFEAETSRILDLCPRLGHLGFVPNFLIPTMVYQLPRMNPTITSLEFTPDVDFTIVLAALTQLCRGLRSLSLPFSETYRDTYPRLNFPVLEELRALVLVPVKSDRALSTPPPSLWNWSMPVLQRLWLVSRARASGNGSRESWLVCAPLFLDAFGTNISFLSLHVANLGEPIILRVRCPKLKHLVITTSYWRSRAVPTVESHAGVRYLDVWCQWNAEMEPSRLHLPDVHKLKSGFPCLVACRFLDASFIHSHRLPLEFPPGLPAFRGEIVFEGPDGHSEDANDDHLPLPDWWETILDFVDPASVYRQYDLTDSVPFEDLGDPYTVSTCWTSDKDESDDGVYSDGDSDSFVDEGHGDEFYSEELWEVDRDEALEIFSTVHP